MSGIATKGNGGAFLLEQTVQERLATEMGWASLEVGLGRLGFPEVASWTLPTNLASQWVMEKLDFRYERDFEFAGLRHRFYRMVGNPLA
jgi:RimJ/RimL family protein N-acetyltransferase